MHAIRDVIVDAVRVPRRLFKNARGRTTHIDAAIVQVHCNDGTIGLGEADPIFPCPHNFLHEIVDVIRYILTPDLIGKDPCNIDALRVRMDKILVGHTLAKDAVEVALVDLCAKLYGVPAAMLLGGQHADVIPVVAPLGIRTPDEMAQEAADFIKQGFAGVKLKIGGDPATDVARIRSVREAVGEHVIIRADANEAYDFPTALKFLRDIEPFQLQSVEQPLPGWDLDGMSRLSNRSATPLMADESLKDAASALEIIRRNAAQLFHLKVQGRGGLLRARRIMAIADAAGIPCVVGQISEMSIGVSADAVLAASGTTLLPGEMTGPLIINGDVVTQKLDITAGKIYLSRAPGLGLELDQAALARYRVPDRSAAAKPPIDCVIS